jgi:hypothetical protein
MQIFFVLLSFFKKDRYIEKGNFFLSSNREKTLIENIL